MIAKAIKGRGFRGVLAYDLGSSVPASISTWRRLSGTWGVICTGVIIRVVSRLTICYSRGRLSAADSTGQRRQPARSGR